MLYNYQMKKILVVGSKNTYRSIIVAEYLKKAISLKGKSGFEVSSGGIMAFPDIPAEPAAVEQLENLGISGEFKSKALSKQAVKEADIILTMSDKIKAAILIKFPDRAPVVYTFKSFFGAGDGEFSAGPDTGSEASVIIEKGIDKLDVVLK